MTAKMVEYQAKMVEYQAKMVKGAGQNGQRSRPKWSRLFYQNSMV